MQHQLGKGEQHLLEAWIAEHIVPLLESLFHTIGWGGVVVIMALESANIPIPSEVTCLLYTSPSPRD